MRFDWSEFERALTRRAATSAKDYRAVMVEQARALLRAILRLTPPGHGGMDGTSRKAQEHGQARVAGDVGRIYGTPAGAFALLEQSDPETAAAFWRAHDEGETALAAKIVRANLGAGYGPWDGGTVHKRNWKPGGLRARRDKVPVYFVSQPDAVAAFVKEKQGNVMFLSAGWEDAAEKLGVSLPQFIGKHDAPGAGRVDVTADRITITLGNDVAYGPAASLQRRVQEAIDQTTGGMVRQWDQWQEKLNKSAGL